MASLADELRKLKDRLTQTAKTAVSNVRGNIQALSDKDTRSDYVRGILATPIKTKAAPVINDFVARTEPLYKNPVKTVLQTPVSGPVIDRLQQALNSAPSRFARSAFNTVTEAPVKVVTSLPRAASTVFSNRSAKDELDRDRWLSDTMFQQSREATKRGDLTTARKLADMAGDTGREAGAKQITRGEDILEQMKKLSAASFRTLLLAAAGKANPRDILLAGGLGTGIGAGQAKLTKQDVAAGAGEGLGGSVKFAGLNKVSSKVLPFVDKIKYLPARAAVRGAQNLAEDVVYAKAGENRNLTAPEAIASTLLGAGFETGGAFLSKLGKADIEAPKKSAGGYRVNAAGRLFDPDSGRWVGKEEKAAYSAARKAQDRVKAAGGPDSYWLTNDPLVKLPGEDRWVPKSKIDEYKSDVPAVKVSVVDDVKGKKSTVDIVDRVAKSSDKSPVVSDSALKIGGTGVVDEPGVVNAELAANTRSLFNPDQIDNFHRVQRLMSSKRGAEGDIETLRKIDPKAVNTALEAVQEMNPNITDEAGALDYIANFPKAADTRPPKPSYGVGDSVYLAEASDLTSQKISDRAVAGANREAERSFKEWSNAIFGEAKATKRTVNRQVDDIARLIREATKSPVARDLSSLRDPSNYDKSFKDVYRIFEKVFGGRFEAEGKPILEGFNNAKKGYTDYVLDYVDKLKTDVTKGLGIKLGSRESALVQLYGEKQMTLPELKAEAPEKWENIVKADKWFRSTYDKLLSNLNDVEKRIYPNNPEKWTPKRADYYRHFREMQGMSGLKNLFDTPAGIDPELVGTSWDTQPKSMWQSFKQKRLGKQTEIDAVGGFMNLLPSISYSTHIDPQIGVFRSLAKELKTTAGSTDDKSLNNLILFLERFSDDLSGKTNKIDAGIQELTGRQFFRVLNWVNGRVKANTMLYNLRSSVAQIFGLPNGIASAGPKYSLEGAKNAALNPQFAYNKSGWIRERYLGSALDSVDERILSKPKQFGSWLLGVGDRAGTDIIWNAHYIKAMREGMDDAKAVAYADDLTRKLVAGRGIGEVPLLQKAQITKLVAPFQLEVQNMWHVMGDFAKDKKFGKIAALMVYNWMFNEVAEKVTGNRVVFDPIDALVDAFGDEEKSPAEKAGRVAGEVVGNVFGGNLAATVYPEAGLPIGEVDPVTGERKKITRENFFGEADPTRFGGGLIASKALSDPLYSLLPPMGGGQIKKTKEAAEASGRGYSQSSTGRVRYPIDKSNPLEVAQALAFGQYATGRARKYFDENKTPLGDKDSAYLREEVKGGAKATEVYDSLDKRRSFEAQVKEIQAQIKSGAVDPKKAPATAVAEAFYRKIADAPKDKRLETFRALSAYMTPEVKDEIVAIQKMAEAGLSSDDRLLLFYPSTIRARAVYNRLLELSDKNRAEKYQALVKAGVITAEMKPALLKLLSAEGK